VHIKRRISSFSFSMDYFSGKTSEKDSIDPMQINTKMIFIELVLLFNWKIDPS